MSNNESSENKHANVLLLPQYEYWFNAIRNDNDKEICSVLKTCDIDTKSKLLNGSFQFPEISAVKRLPTKRPTLTHPFTLAAMYGSMRTCDVMVKNDVDIFLQEKEGFNVFHCLVCIAFYQPHNEESIAQSYIRLCSIIRKENVETLLRMEDTTGLRPLEFAAHQGTLKMMMTIFETSGIYKIREDVIGVRRYRWYDITEYETENMSLIRRFMNSPIHFVNVLDVRHIHSDFGRHVFSESIIADWIRKNVQCKRFIIIVYFVHRLLYSCVFFVYQLSSQISFANQYSNDNSSELYYKTEIIYPKDSAKCVNSHTNVSHTTKRCMEAYLILLSFTTVMNDIIQTYHAFRRLSSRLFIFTELSGNSKKTNFDGSSSFQRMANSLFAIMVLVEISIYNNPTKGKISFLVVMHLFQTPIITTSILHHMAIFHSIGHMILHIRRMFFVLFSFIVVFSGFLFVFTRLFIMMSEMESIGGCISQFSSFASGAYSSYFVFLITFDLRSLSIGTHLDLKRSTSALSSFLASFCITC